MERLRPAEGLSSRPYADRAARCKLPVVSCARHGCRQSMSVPSVRSMSNLGVHSPRPWAAWHDSPAKRALRAICTAGQAAPGDDHAGQPQGQQQAHGLREASPATPSAATSAAASAQRGSSSGSAQRGRGSGSGAVHGMEGRDVLRRHAAAELVQAW